MAQFVQQCRTDDLNLNVAKTKEMLIDFRRRNTDHEPVTIEGEEVARVEEYKYLGFMVQSNLRWDSHVGLQCTKASKRTYHLRKLREFKVQRNIMQLFYSSVIQSGLIFGCVVWGNYCSAGAKKKLARIERQAKKITGAAQEEVTAIIPRRTITKARNIMADPAHPLNSLYTMLPSGRRFRSLKSRTNRYRDSFVPASIVILNSISN